MVNYETTIKGKHLNAKFMFTTTASLNFNRDVKKFVIGLFLLLYVFETTLMKTVKTFKKNNSHNNGFYLYIYVKTYLLQV